MTISTALVRTVRLRVLRRRRDLPVTYTSGLPLSAFVASSTRTVRYYTLVPLSASRPPLASLLSFIGGHRPPNPLNLSDAAPAAEDAMSTSVHGA